MKIAAIDIGSNALRLLISHVHHVNGLPVFKKAALIRLPVRLGEDVFLTGKISRHKAKLLEKSIMAYKEIMDVYEVKHFRACATSAMREAENKEEIIEKILKKTGIQIEVLSGIEEAHAIFANQWKETLEPHKVYLYVDVGGGSTELTLFANHQAIASESFKIGTIRLLYDQVNKNEWMRMKQWLLQNTKELKNITVIGSGGNINKLYKLAEIKSSKPISFDKLKDLEKFLTKYTYEDRIKVLGLNPDRADVIIPACKIYLSVMKWAGSKKMIVPQIGLSDGLIRLQYQNLTNES